MKQIASIAKGYSEDEGQRNKLREASRKKELFIGTNGTQNVTKANKLDTSNLKAWKTF